MEKKTVEETGKREETPKALDISTIIEGNEDGVWLKVVSNVYVKLKAATPEYRTRLLKRCTTKYYKRHRPVEETDDEKFNALLAQHVVVDWKGIEKDGEKFPCTPDNKVWLMQNWSEFNDFVQDATMHLERYREEQKEEAGKNS